MSNPSDAPTSFDSGIDVLSDTTKQRFSPISTEKGVMSPTNDTDKQKTDYNADTGMEVFHIPPSDTDKVFVPHLPPVSSEKEIRQPTNNTDKQLFPVQDGSSTSSTRLMPSHTFRVEKSNSMGLIMPQNQTLLLRSLNPTTKLDQGPAFITSEMDWVDVCAVNPPPFELYTAHAFSRPELVARFEPRGWQGLTSMKSEFEVSCGGDRQKWEVVRKGLNRTYQLKGMLGHEGREFVWKGSTKTVKSMVGDEMKTKGNLKLTTMDDEVLAIWQQWRDRVVLGDIVIFENAKDKVDVEVILTSCICVVSSERANSLNWFGGLGK